MPDRLVRDELLTSERYCAVTNDAKLLFIHLLLAADDFGNFSGKNFSIRTRCFPGEPMQPERIDRWLTELVDQDLIRFYERDGDRYVHIPRFRQRLRSMRPKYPLSPWTTVEEKQYLIGRDAGHTPDSGPTHDGHIPEKRSEGKRREEKSPPKEALSGEAPDAPRLDVTKPQDWDFTKPPAKGQEARYILAFLNKVTGHKYQDAEANTKLIRARLKESSIRQAKRLIVTMAAKWEDDDRMREYLRPATLFNATNYHQYLGQLPTMEAANADASTQP